MKERRLLYAIGWVKDTYIEEMNQPGNRKSLRLRLWLIAAILALTLLLVGCVAVYLRLQDLSFGKKTYVQEFDSKGFYIGPTERTRDLLTINGYVGSPHQLAVEEWLQFKESYDPNGELLTNEPDIPEIPNAEETVYGCYTLEMVDKLHEIVSKYDLKLLGEWVPIQRWQSEIAQEALGVDSFLKPGAQAEISAFSGMLYPPYNFKFDYGLTMTGEDALWPHEIMVGQNYGRKGYFEPHSYWSLDLDRVQQWNYTTSDGYDLLLVLDDYGRGYIFLEKEEAYLTFYLSTYFGPTKYPSPEDFISKEGLEQAAECFDYSIATPELDFVRIQSELDAAEEAYWTEQRLPMYSDFDECMKREGPWRGPDGYDYTFYDDDGDEEVELIFGSKGMPEAVIDLEAGETQYRIYGGSYFCENGIIHDIMAYDFTTYEVHTFNNWPEFKLCLTRKNGVWHQSEEPVDYSSVDTLPVLTEQEVQEIFDRYPHVELIWKPVMEYTFADGTTVADIAPEPPEPVTVENLHPAYLEKAREFRFFTHYCFYDLDGDGIDEMLLSEDGQNLRSAFYLKDGQVKELPWQGDRMFPCGGGVWEVNMVMNTEGGVELEEHIFYHMVAGKPELLHYVAWNKATASWVADRDYTPMEEETANRILEMYPRVNVQLLPLG